MPQEEKLEVENTEVNFYWFAQRDQFHQERRICLTPML
jgi:hypothetical protein